MASSVEPEPEPEQRLRPHVISLGTDCFWRTQATRLGWIDGRLQGYESGPFDLAYHSYSAVCNLISQDFAGYMDPGALRIDRVEEAHASARAAVHGRLPGVGFNHEGEPACDATTFDAWAIDDFADLRARYTRRVENFRRKVAAATDISKTGEIGAVFLLNHYEHPTELCAVIEARWPSLRFVILTINLVGQYPQDMAVSPGDAASEYASIIDELEDEDTVRQIAEEEGIPVAANATLAHCKQLLHEHFAARPPRQPSHQAEELRGRTFVHTFVRAAGEWTDTKYRWARGLAPSTFDECSRLPVDALPPEVRWSSGSPQRGDSHACQRWCFYNVRLPHPELSWIGTIQVAGEELDHAVRSAVDNSLESLLLGYRRPAFI